MEREKLTHIFSKRSDFFQDFRPLEEDGDKLNDERKTESMFMFVTFKMIVYVHNVHSEKVNVGKERSMLSVTF